jgi:molecular chaperone GrpE
MNRTLINPLRRTILAGRSAYSARMVSPSLRMATVRYNSTTEKPKEEKMQDKEASGASEASEPAGETKKASESQPAEEAGEAEPPLVTELRSKLQQKDKELAEMKNHYARSVADFRNLQETTKKEVQKAKDFALQKFAKDLLESVDNFGLALQSVKEETLKNNKELSNLVEGVNMTKNIFEKTLSKYGVEKIDPMGEQFDPNQHEATFEIPQPDKEPGTVMHVQQVGFTLNSRVLRPAKVGLVKGEN